MMMMMSMMMLTTMMIIKTMKIPMAMIAMRKVITQMMSQKGANVKHQSAEIESDIPVTETSDESNSSVNRLITEEIIPILEKLAQEAYGESSQAYEIYLYAAPQRQMHRPLRLHPRPLVRRFVQCWCQPLEVFEELLLDADWSVNAGSWMWLSCSSFFQQFFHCYCPVGFGCRTDLNGDYVRHYLPILKGFPAKYIYDPWNAPDSVQVAAKCIIGVHYPKPMVIHAEASRLNIERMKQIYQQLSRYRGLGLLASVPSNQNGNGGTMYSLRDQLSENSGIAQSHTVGVMGKRELEHDSTVGGEVESLAQKIRRHCDDELTRGASSV
ncbi:cryptochrome-1-like [Scyliorhinus canicula]|uniref:cryptochrome-1-like n=1 Tax=Scyliorhinus canicula TaxID=7830 RepID=UPI0018F5E7DC|nr:cryptochrome-1-like [Scyliorhinus canicula]